MTACKYWDCGWCYAPDYLKTNAVQGGCFEPEHCPNFRNSEPVQYETPMTKSEEEIEKVKAEIKVLEKKLSFLEELEKTKTPVEEAFKDWMGVYPPTNPSVDNIFDIRWRAFQMGYNAAYEQKVSEEPEELKTLHQMFYEKKWNNLSCDEFCDVVKEWMSQYTHYVMTGEWEYLKGYEECLTVLEENLK